MANLFSWTDSVVNFLPIFLTLILTVLLFGLISSFRPYLISKNVVILVPTDLPISSKGVASFRYVFSHADWGLFLVMAGVDASAATEICEWLRSELKYISLIWSIRLNHIHSAVIAHRNPFFDLFQQMIYVVAQVNLIMLIVVAKVFWINQTWSC